MHSPQHIKYTLFGAFVVSTLVAGVGIDNMFTDGQVHIVWVVVAAAGVSGTVIATPITPIDFPWHKYLRKQVRDGSDKRKGYIRPMGQRASTAKWEWRVVALAVMGAYIAAINIISYRSPRQRTAMPICPDASPTVLVELVGEQLYSANAHDANAYWQYTVEGTIKNDTPLPVDILSVGFYAGDVDEPVAPTFSDSDLNPDNKTGKPPKPVAGKSMRNVIPAHGSMRYSVTHQVPAKAIPANADPSALSATVDYQDPDTVSRITKHWQWYGITCAEMLPTTGKALIYGQMFAAHRAGGKTGLEVAAAGAATYL